MSLYILPGFINYKFDDYTHIQYLRIDFGCFGGSAAKCMLIVLLYFVLKRFQQRQENKRLQRTMMVKAFGTMDIFLTCPRCDPTALCSHSNVNEYGTPREQEHKVIHC